MTTALDVAAWIVSRHGHETRITEASLNVFCFYAQVISLRDTHGTLFDDPIEAQASGPVCPDVRRVYGRHGHDAIVTPETPVPDPDPVEADAMKNMWKDYGWLSALDLVRLPRRPGGAWSMTWAQGPGSVITPDTILTSCDVAGFDPSRTFAASIRRVEARYTNTLKLLEDS